MVEESGPLLCGATACLGCCHGNDSAPRLLSHVTRLCRSSRELIKTWIVESGVSFSGNIRCFMSCPAIMLRYV